jgi:hypothetical protein
MPSVLIVQNNKGFKEKSDFHKIYVCVCVCVCVRVRERERERERSFEVMGYCLHLLRSCGGLDGVEQSYLLLPLLSTSNNLLNCFFIIIIFV